MSKTVQFQTIQFSISMQFRSIWPIDSTLIGATTQGQSGPGSNGNEGVLCFPWSSSITGSSPSDCLMSYLGHSLAGRVLLLYSQHNKYAYIHIYMQNTYWRNNKDKQRHLLKNIPLTVFERVVCKRELETE